MKTFVILSGSLVWSLLFYNQFIGLNIFLFSILILIGIFSFNPEAIKTKENKIFFVGLLLSSFFVFYYASVFPMVMFVFSLVFITTANYPGSISVLTRPFISFIGALEFWLVRWVEKYSVTTENLAKQEGVDKKAINVLKFIFLIIGSILIFILFIFLYRDSNLIFKSITDQIEIDISPEFFGFTFLGIVILNAIFNSTYFSKWINYEENLPNRASESIHVEDNFQLKRSYIFSGLLFFLNILLAFINIIDMFYFIGIIKLPESINHSEMVHQAIGSVIFSIVVAMVLLLYIYKTKPRNNKVSKWMLRFALIWAIQNFLLVITAFNKNYAYIEMHDLTYKRIGVLIYLLLSVVGLLFVWIKLTKEKSNWYVLRKTSFTFYLVLLFFSCFNWPIIVTNYNLNKAVERGKIDDIDYLINLDNRNLHLLSDFSKTHPELFQEYDLIAIQNKIDQFQETNLTWQSFSLSNYFLKKSLANKN